MPEKGAIRRGLQADHQLGVVTLNVAAVAVVGRWKAAFPELG